mmetsp:Transcript_19532/g.35422  ORF Transcript_19532/g.35422 Transcript_19532/m.35422 type:complete len:216 (+) Transcript_19532:980-1627(+)
MADNGSRALKTCMVDVALVHFAKENSACTAQDTSAFHRNNAAVVTIGFMVSSDDRHVLDRKLFNHGRPTTTWSFCHSSTGINTTRKLSRDGNEIILEKTLHMPIDAIAGAAISIRSGLTLIRVQVFVPDCTQSTSGTASGGVAILVLLFSIIALVSSILFFLLSIICFFFFAFHDHYIVFFILRHLNLDIELFHTSTPRYRVRLFFFLNDSHAFF